MNIKLSTNQTKISTDILISGSKSESNRLLILQELYPNLTIENLSDSDDSIHLQEALSGTSNVADISHAGTAMRFLTAYFASQEESSKILQGSERMHNRPIAILVDALRSLGAEIKYLEKNGYPPLEIHGKKMQKNSVKINGNVSSQYISALMLIAPKLEDGLEIELVGTITSVPYIEMTLSLLRQLHIEATFEQQTIRIENQKEITDTTIVVESDWSSASYFYSIIALSDIGSTVRLSSYKKNSLQGDSILAQIYLHFGVTTTFEDNHITITKNAATSNEKLIRDLKNAPDIAQTIVVTCFGLGITCDLNGLHTLKIKETDRLEALREELTKLGASISVTENSLHLEPQNKIQESVAIATYNDHRMAMAFAPLALKTNIQIEDANVVTKSYRNFWNDIKKIGFQVTEL